MLIVICGIDGCGKSTVGKFLAKRLRAGFLEFPNRDSPTGKLIDGYLRKKLRIESFDEVSGTWSPDKEAGALAHQCLQVANRLEVFKELALASHGMQNYVTFSQGYGYQPTDLVLARYTASGLVYGQLDGIELSWLEGVLGVLPDADVNLLLELEPLKALERRFSRDKHDGKAEPEIYEGKLRVAEQLHGLYQQLWAKHLKTPGWGVVDASRPILDVVDDCYQQVIGRFIGGKVGDA